VPVIDATPQIATGSIDVSLALLSAGRVIRRSARRFVSDDQLLSKRRAVARASIET
jgi:hypothetical protein